MYFDVTNESDDAPLTFAFESAGGETITETIPAGETVTFEAQLVDWEVTAQHEDGDGEGDDAPPDEPALPDDPTSVPDHEWPGVPTAADDVIREPPEGAHAIAIWSDEAGADLLYRIEGVGRATLLDPQNARLAGLPNNDHVQNRDDGTFVIEGYTGNEFGDAFAVDGYVTSVERTDGDSAWHVEALGNGVGAFEHYSGPMSGE